MFERLFELLFKYRPVVFEQGDLAFSPPWPALVAVLAAGVAGAGVVWLYARTARGWPIGRRAALVGMRLAVLGLLLFSLMRPVLVLHAVAAQRNFLAVLVDDSRSMAIGEAGAAPRSAFVRDALGTDGTLRAALAGRFALRFFRFSSSTDRLGDPRALTFAGTRSYIGQGLTRVAEELAGLPVSGIVLVSDGADTSETALTDSLRSLKATGLPVFTVGVGDEAFARDVQIGRVQPPATVLKGTTVVADVLISQRGYAGRTVPLTVEDEGHAVGSTDVVLPPDGEPATARVRFTLADAGPRLLRFRLPPLDGEQVRENNVREALVQVLDRRERLLYIEGEPRFEMKFLRQAVADDKNLQVVTLQRTAEHKFLRLDVDAPSDLTGGFPATRDELFAYHGLVLGSIEAGAFTADQLRMIADFAGVRGGGLLALGGRHAFAEGGYDGTPVAEALPVVLEPARTPGSFVEEIKVRPTREGETHIATQIADSETASADRWRKLPAVTTVNPIHRVKPGAAVLLEGGLEGREPQVVLAFQRYGAGKSLAMPIQDSWTWQMDASIGVDDPTHETLWRRLLRWLVEGVPDRVTARAARDRIEPGETVDLQASVRDAKFVEANDAAVRARVVAPSGRERDLPLTFAVERNGEYQASFVADERGLYEVHVEAARGRDALGSAVTYVRAVPSDEEYFDAGMRPPLLRRIAEETGGRFYTPATVKTLPEDITYLGRGVTDVQQMDLWDMPVILLLLVGALGAEWFFRRRWGLA